MLRYTIARESPGDVFAPEVSGTYRLGDFDCIADPVTLVARPRGNYASEYKARLVLEPYLHSWSAKAELVDRIPMSFHFVGSELADRRPRAGWRRRDRGWLLQAMRALARRVAEVEAGIASLPILTQADIRQ
jgi:hypothetical protein